MVSYLNKFVATRGFGYSRVKIIWGGMKPISNRISCILWNETFLICFITIQAMLSTSNLDLQISVKIIYLRFKNSQFSQLIKKNLLSLIQFITEKSIQEYNKKTSPVYYAKKQISKSLCPCHHHHTICCLLFQACTNVEMEMERAYIQHYAPGSQVFLQKWVNYQQQF